MNSQKKYKVKVSLLVTIAIVSALWLSTSVFLWNRYADNYEEYKNILSRKETSIKNIIYNQERYERQAKTDRLLAAVLRRALNNTHISPLSAQKKAKQLPQIAADALPKASLRMAPLTTQESVIIPLEIFPLEQDFWSLPEGVSQERLAQEFGTQDGEYKLIENWLVKRVEIPLNEARKYVAYLAIEFPLSLAKTIKEICIFGGWMIPLGFFIFLGVWKLVSRSLRPVEETIQRLEEFTSDVSHEIKTPIAVILSSIELAEKTRDWDDASEEIKTASRQILATVSSLLNIATLTHNFEEERTIDLRKHITEMVDRLPKDKNIQIHIDTTLALSEYTISLGHWSICLENFLSNALKFTKDEIYISLQKRAISVANNGPHIEEKNLSRVFDRFWQEQKSQGEYTGYGVGLAIVKKIADLHKWKVDAQNTESGVVFSLSF